MSTAAKVAAMAAYFGISRAAIYMWDDDAIPELRALQIQQNPPNGRPRHRLYGRPRHAS